VTRPLLTVATPVLLLLQLTFCPLGEVEADRESISPTYMEALVWDRVTPESVTLTWQVAL